MARNLRIEADGGSRGNPGVAGYGAIVIDAQTDELLVRRAEPLGTASNNVAEYKGMTAGLEAALAIDPAASVVVALDSKLVVEQMSGRWKIKHPDMRILAAQAQALVREFINNGGAVSFEWIPRESNKVADALSNEAMDGNSIDTLDAYLATQGGPPHTNLPGVGAPEERRARTAQPSEAAIFGAATLPGVTLPGVTLPGADTQPQLGEVDFDDLDANNPASDDAGSPGSAGADETEPGATTSESTAYRPKNDPFAPISRIVLVRHGVTPFTEQGRLDGRGGADPDLSELGRAQAARAGELMVDFLDGTPATLTTSTLQRARSTGAAVAAAIGLSRDQINVDPEFDEQNFGDWDGAAARDLIKSEPEAFMRLREDPEYARPGGESHAEMADRVLAAFDHLATIPGTHIVVCHRKPIMTMLGHVLGVPHDRLFRLLAAPGSLQSIEILGGGYPQVAFTNRH